MKEGNGGRDKVSGMKPDTEGAPQLPARWAGGGGQADTAIGRRAFQFRQKAWHLNHWSDALILRKWKPKPREGSGPPTPAPPRSR